MSDNSGRRSQTILPAPARPTVFIECTDTYHSDVNTGIQRVVRNILRPAPDVAREFGYDVVPVALESGRFVPIDAATVLLDKQRIVDVQPKQPNQPKQRINYKFVLRVVARAPWRLFQRTLVTLLPFQKVRNFVFAPPSVEGLAYYTRRPWRIVRRIDMIGPSMEGSLDLYKNFDNCILLLADSSWSYMNWSTVERFRKNGGRVVGLIYDLIPITHPHAFSADLNKMFRRWLVQNLNHSELLISISKTVAQDVEAFSRQNKIPKRGGVKFGYFHLGSGLDFVQPSDEVRPKISEVFHENAHTYLMVGSIEPRKNHDFVLSAFEQYWAQGGVGSLVIVGRLGWKNEAFLKRVKCHPLLGKSLFILRDASDSELDYLYRHGAGLIMASQQEGFGLPVVEAFQRGLQVLCSDLPVLREIGEGRAWFFGLESPKLLSETLFAFEQRHPPGCEFDRTPMPWLDWKQSTEWLFREMFGLLGIATLLQDDIEA